MAETTSFHVGEKPKRFAVADIIIAVIVVAVIATLAIVLVRQLGLQHEVVAAKTVSDRFVGDLQDQNAIDARSLGDTSFQASHSVAELQQLFKTVQPYAPGTPTVAEQAVTNDKTGKNVRVIYKYNPKKTYYIRVVVSQHKGASKWQLVNIAGGTSESALQKPATVAN